MKNKIDCLNEEIKSLNDKNNLLEKTVNFISNNKLN